MASATVTPRNLAKVMAESGIILTRKQRADLLAGSVANLTRRVKNFIAKYGTAGSGAELAKPEAVEDPLPFLGLINGLTSGKRFRVVARLGKDGAVVAAKNSYNFKVKLYPNKETFGFNDSHILAAGGEGLYHRTAPPAFVYDRFFMETDKLKAFIESLRNIKGIQIASPANTELLFAGKDPDLALQKVVSTPRKKAGKVLKKRRPAKK